MERALEGNEVSWFDRIDTNKKALVALGTVELDFLSVGLSASNFVRMPGTVAAVDSLSSLNATRYFEMERRLGFLEDRTTMVSTNTAANSASLASLTRSLESLEVKTDQILCIQLLDSLENSASCIARSPATRSPTP